MHVLITIRESLQLFQTPKDSIWRFCAQPVCTDALVTRGVDVIFVIVNQQHVAADNWFLASLFQTSRAHVSQFAYAPDPAFSVELLHHSTGALPALVVAEHGDFLAASWEHMFQRIDDQFCLFGERDDGNENSRFESRLDELPKRVANPT